MDLFSREKTAEEEEVERLTGGLFRLSESYKKLLKENGLDTNDGNRIRNIIDYEIANKTLDVDEIEGRLNELVEGEYLRLKDKDVEEKHKEDLLYHPDNPDNDILDDIKKDMVNLASYEARTSWMHVGTLLSFNSTEQMIGAGFKALIDQNKILIKQNELLRRQNEIIIDLLSQDESSKKWLGKSF